MSIESPASPLPPSRWRSFRLRHPLASFFCLVAVALLPVACGLAGDKPSTSAPGGINDSNALWDACMERGIAIDDWSTEKLRKLANDLIEGRKSLLDATTEEEWINKENGQMKLELESNCAEKADALRQSANRADQEIKQSSSDCDDCLSIRQLSEEYEANSFSTDQRYSGTRHNFGGTVESIDQEPSVPPKPIVRVRSDGGRITFRFGWDEDYSWVLELSKGDWVKANCEISSIGSTWTSNDTVPFLKDCTETD